MSESELSIAYSDLMLEVAAFLGYSPDSTAWTTAEEAELDRYVQAGVRRVYYPPAVAGVEAGYAWTFLSPVATLSTVASTGTQDLPPALGRVLGQFHFAPAVYKPSIVQVSEDKYRALLADSNLTGPPQVARVRQKAGQDGVGQRLEVSWWPIPDAAYDLTYRYEGYSGKLSAVNPYPLGGMRHAELYVQSCLAVAEQRANDERGLHAEEFERLLAAAIQQDRRMNATNYGHMGGCEGHSAVPRHFAGVRHDIIYKGNTY